MGRKTYFRELNQSFLIVCEGKETEPLYFRAFKVPGDVKNVDVKGLGKSTINLVYEANILKEKSEYDQVWVVFDIDNCTPDQVNEAMRLAKKYEIKVAYSNQAFELWYLLHFNYYNVAINREQYKQKLSKLLGFKYEKTTPGLYTVLLKKQHTAIANSKKLLASYNPLNPCNDDPSTTVFQLVEELNQFSPDSR